MPSTTTHSIDRPIAILGLGAMGRALATALLRTAHPLTVWNRPPGRDDELLAAGATRAATPADAVRGADLVIVCLFDHASVHDVLDPAAHALRGARLANLTSTTPAEARELAEWATGHDIAYLDGAIMAVPDMIGAPGATLLYSGSREVYRTHRDILETLGAAEYLGEESGAASLHDLAMLAGMYTMFAGFLHGAAMIRASGGSAVTLSDRAAPFLAAMIRSLPAQARTVDSGDYTAARQNLHLHHAALAAIARAGGDLDLDTRLIDPLRDLIEKQIDTGHGGETFERIIEGLSAPH